MLAYVEEGVALVCDHIPSHNLDGKPLNLLDPFFRGDLQHFFKEVTLVRSNFGTGRTLLFSTDLNELYTSSVERDDLALRYALKNLIRQFYDVDALEPDLVNVLAIGIKRGNRLIVVGKEIHI